MPEAPTIVWFRLDLRLADNPALTGAVERGGPVVPVFIDAPEEEKPWVPGAASRWWLHQSLESLSKDLERLGAKLILRRGPTLAALRTLVKETGARAVVWNRRYEPTIISRDTEIKSKLEQDGVSVQSFNGALLAEPWEIRTRQDAPYQVFTPYWKACLARNLPAEPLAPPPRLLAFGAPLSSLPVDDLELEPEIDWASGMRETWQPGEKGATKNLDQFLKFAIEGYADARNRPAEQGTSRLSPHLHFGEVSVRTIWRALAEHAKSIRAATKRKSIDVFRAELGWREFAHHLLYHFPETTDRPLRAAFEDFPHEKNASHFAAWKRGKTGFPIVDAGMRELWTTGWMHNRVRMIVASFLTKDLLMPWQIGAKWFWDTLVDADLANNTLGWQWTAGCGADAAPFFRIFNPVSQGRKFDPEGDYVRRWVPELASLDGESIHDPWKVSEPLLNQRNVDLQRNYFHPVVDHAVARKQALEMYQAHVARKRADER